MKPRRADDATRIAARRAVETDRVASCPDGRETGHAHPMASKGVRAVLAVQVQASWAPEIADGTPAIDRGDGGDESHLGRRANCRGAVGEASDSRVTSDSSALHVSWCRTSGWRTLADVDDVCASSCQRCVGVRFLRDGDGDVPVAKGGRSSCPSSLQSRLRSRFDAQRVVHRNAKLLLAPQISLSRRDRDVTKEKLNLIQLAPAKWHKLNTGTVRTCPRLPTRSAMTQ